ncbi:hypothetical protein K7432_007494 [Basidiobolus ranarum]|uniref:RRM domain-containing protein n=1 Tax=Basidiobolus ranarum TaxID=34480 RepID=A0ABR2WTC9_9FUNG
MGSKVTEKSPKASKVEKTPKKEKSEDKLKVKTPKDKKEKTPKKEKKEKTPKKEKKEKTPKKEKKEKKVESSDSEAEEEVKEEKAASPVPEKEAESSDSEVETPAEAVAEVAEVEQTSTKRSADDEEVEESETKKQKVEEEGPTTVFVGGLSWSVDNDWLRDEMKDCGEIVDVRIITDRDSGRSKGFGYVEFADHAGAQKAMEASGREIDGRAIRVDFSEKKPAAKKPERTYESQNNEPSDTLFIGNLSFNTTEDSVRAAFAECGEVLSIRLPTDRDTGRPKGFGYVQFASVDVAKAAMEWNGSDLDGRNIRLDFAAARQEGGGDRGFGGGRGGGRGGRGGARGGFSSNRGGVGEFKGTRITFD